MKDSINTHRSEHLEELEKSFIWDIERFIMEFSKLEKDSANQPYDKYKNAILQMLYSRFLSLRSDIGKLQDNLSSADIIFDKEIF